MKKQFAIMWQCLLLVGLVLTSCQPYPQGRIAFVSESDHDGTPFTEIYVMNIDGSNLIRLTFNESFAYSPTWSPGGTRIAFQSQHEGRRHIYVMDADGSNVIRLTSVWGEQPAWSPDGMHIAFVRDTQVYVMDADGNNMVQITNDTMPSLNPSWSPDGTRIAFECYSENIAQVCVMGADGSSIVRLTDGPWHHRLPVWSPDGTRIAFASNRWTENAAGHYFSDEVFLMNTDGSNIIQLTDSRPYESTEPAWSPDGQLIVFSRATEQGYAICIMSADGSDVVQLTNGGARNSEPTWSP